MTATIKDVAKLANTSKSTVSRFLNGVSVNKDTENAIRKAIQELNYHPNMNARRLVMDSSQKFGIVVDDISNRFYSSILKGIRQILDANGYDCVFYTWNHLHDREVDFLNLLYEGQVDGLLYLSFLRRTEADVQSMKEAPFPIILIGDDANTRLIPSIDLDNYAGEVAAVNYLYRIGHRAIAYIAGPESAGATRGRTAGYLEAMGELGLRIEPNWICASDWSNEGGYTAMKQLLQHDGFSAVIASNDESAIGAMTCLQERGYNIPRDFSIIGFDDIDISRWIFPSLTTMRQPFEELGQLAASLLVECVNKNIRSDERRLLKPELIIRSSSTYV